MRSTRLAAIVASAVCGLALAPFGSALADHGSVRLIAFNDIHGYLTPTDGEGPSIVAVPGSTTGASVPTGGLAYMSTLIQSLETGHPNHIVVAAGDNIGASPYTSNIAHDEPTVDILNQLGLQVSSVGNHEFDKGLTELKRIQGNNGTSTCYPPDGQFGIVGVDTCLEPGNVFNGASWTYLAANVVNSATGQTIFPATYIKKFRGGDDGIKVGFVGLTFKDTPLEVNQNGVKGLTFGDEATAINLAADQLKKQGANAVVVLLHQGGTTTSVVYGDATCPGFSGDLLPILDQLSSKVDIVVSGHTHTDYICQYKGKLVTQSGYYGTGVTAIDLTFGDDNHLKSATAFNTPVINDTSTTGYPTGITPLAKDPTIDAAIQHYVSLSAAAGSVIVGQITAPVTISPPPAGCVAAGTCDSGKRNKTVENAMGDLSADAFLAAFNDSQIAFIQAGAVRTTLKSVDGLYPPAGAGNVSYSALFATTPFHDTLYEISMTGPQILRVLEQQWEFPNNTLFFAPGGVGEILMPSSGFTYTWDSSHPAGLASGSGNRVKPGTMMLNGTPIDMTGATTYRVVVQGFLYSGGDNFTVFEKGTNPVQGGFDIAALTAYLGSHSPYTPVTPTRITKLGSNP